MATDLPTYSVVLEMENSIFVDWDEFGIGLRALAREIAASPTPGPSRPKVVVSHGGPDTNKATLQENIGAKAPELARVADLAFASCPGGRYYDLKNNGIALTEGDVLVYMDSDTAPGPGWLTGLLEPFRYAGTVCVNGRTHLLYDDFLSRTFALIWFFPMARDDEKFALKRAINANNVAFRRSWIANHPFPQHKGFKVSCTLLMHQLRREGHEIIHVDARAYHYPPRGWRFFCWRALVTGRDADRKFVELHAPNRARRIVKSFSHWMTMSWRTLRRVLRHAPQTGMPLWEIPFSLIVGLVFYSLAFLGQFGLAAGLVRDEIETVPDYVGHS